MTDDVIYLITNEKKKRLLCLLFPSGNISQLEAMKPP